MPASWVVEQEFYIMSEVGSRYITMAVFTCKLVLCAGLSRGGKRSLPGSILEG
jgi:hypothetical protein